jgi:hypothetical protein
MADVSLDDWQVEKLRLSAFLVAPIVPVEERFWERLLGTLPDEQRSQPHQQLAIEEGPFLSGRLKVQARSDRCDWILSYDPKNSSEEPPTFGPYSAVGGRFRKLMLKWLGDCPTLNRVAFGAILLLPADSLSDAFRRLEDFLPAVKIDPERTQDLSYRINRPRHSRHKDVNLNINRLSTWTALQMLGTVVEVPAGVRGPVTVKQTLPPQNLCRLELDINTIAEHTQEIEKCFLADIFGELVDYANELAVKGDVP